MVSAIKYAAIEYSNEKAGKRLHFFDERYKDLKNAQFQCLQGLLKVINGISKAYYLIFAAVVILIWRFSIFTLSAMLRNMNSTKKKLSKNRTAPILGPFCFYLIS
ncbi:MAG: hypothetical protein DRI70_09425, partial [Bacteroidetes bacterium]